MAPDLQDAGAGHTTMELGTRAGIVLGTAPYMSPEQARGQSVDKRTDIWAFGCTLYEMLSGRRAFSGDTISDTIAAILEREVDWSALPPDTPPACPSLDETLSRTGSAAAAARPRGRRPDRGSARDRTCRE